MAGMAKKSQLAWSTVALRLWELSWPLSGMEVLTFAKELIITAFVGRMGPFELSSLVLSQTLYNVFGNAPMLGIVVAMETFCGQAFGAKKYRVVGVVLQRAVLIVTLFNLMCAFLLSKAEYLMIMMGQDLTIARTAGRFTVMLAPCLVMDGFDQCMRRYLASQSVVQPLMFVTLIATMMTPIYLWFFIIQCDWGLDGAAVAWNCVQCTSLMGMFVYVLWFNAQQEPAKRTWHGWSRECLTDWVTYIQVAIPSMVMICLDWWTFEVIVILSGLLPRPEMTMSMMGITFNVHALCFFAAHGLSGAASTRVGNELGAGRQRLAWLNTQVAVMMGMASMMIFAGALMLSRMQLGAMFATDPDVVELTSFAVPALAISLIGEGANTVLAGVLRGCGRQKVGAIINLGMYWGVGLPFSCFLAFKCGLGAMGLWTGLACTASLQSVYLSYIVFRFDWSLEVTRAKALIASGEAEFEIDEDPVPIGLPNDRSELDL
uniref:Protein DETOXIFICATION n=1 Tax=Dunaliella tertiolecta TaxID=3047 RepID=A0A7S3R462_DUNTE|mmetsp:Transcript_20166/g.56167  ORF Transcript_20166/g.56167 Transcript_20166/m.56167 type:complete len:488 (-) Transcript_20166:366-1829(-)